MGISVTDETLERATRVKRLIGRPQEALLCAKAKRQRQSAQSERKSTTHFGEEPHFFHNIQEGVFLLFKNYTKSHRYKRLLIKLNSVSSIRS
ncbi:hypothetical protein [Lysinibacillus sp. fls2-241-R2A-57]|uniref:hypothetical protein n=1 Tax=Lysinibacillus sp. fls2-241-R2A-57 TaxID=3040292 RepID=UPI0025526489|nr:hypothetical protein [Lysinibacillus sp. fls2-241-R2A-57]